ncbi:MAG: sigma-70 family RNA polymerase sigma factor [Verrucomicrobia bacterium]|nr:sigma-70 family RNA polymerase sigma factor [Verrucomicrobiota bacterium]
MVEERELIPTRQTLLSRLRNADDQEGWKEFFDTYWKLIYSTASKAGLTDAEAQDVVQETVIDVARNMPGFRYDPAKGSFKTWLLNLTRWRIKDQLRKRQPGMHADVRRSETTGTATIERVPDPAGDGLALVWNDDWEKNVVAVAIERVKQRVEPKHFQVFDLCVVKELTAAEAAEALNMSAARIYLAKHRVSRLIKKEIKVLEKKYG